MLERYGEWASRRRVLVGSVAASVVLAVLLDRYFPPSVFEPKVSAKEAIDALSANADSLNNYAISVLTLDTLFPMAYMTLLTGWLYRTWPRAPRWVLILPLVSGLWDYCENIQLAWIHWACPANRDWLIPSALFFGQRKFDGPVVCVLLAITGWLRGRLRREPA